MSNFGEAPVKKEGHTLHIKTGEVWETSEEQKYLEQLRSEIARDLFRTKVNASIAIVAAVLAVAVTVWSFYV